jgi:hypothetical protein
MSPEEVIGKFVSFELMIKGSKQIVEQGVTSTPEVQPVTFKATEEKKEESTSSRLPIDASKLDNEEMALIIKSFCQILKQRRRKDYKPHSKKVCYKCGKPGHFIAKCPMSSDSDRGDDKKGKRKEKKRYYKKKGGDAHVCREWDSDESSTDSSSDEDATNIAINKGLLVCIPFTPPLDHLVRESKFQHLAPTVRATKNHPRWHLRELARRQPHPLTNLRRQRCWPRKRARPSSTPPTKKPAKMTHSARGSAMNNPHPKAVSAPAAPEDNRNLPPGFAPPEGADATEDGEVINVSAEEQLQLCALRIKNRNLQKQKEILEAKRQRVSTQAKVRQMIRDEEQKAQELEQEIALMQREGQLGLQHGPPLQQRAQIEDLFIPQRKHAIPHAAVFQGVNYLDERSPLAPHMQVSPWPANFRAGTYPKYNGSTDPAQYIMSYQVVVASSGGDDATMAKSFIIAIEGPALTWYTRLPTLSIDSWRSLQDKFLLNFQGYRPDTDALAELSLCKQLERETMREYYRKFLTLKSQLPSVDDQIAIHYAISGLRAGVLYSHYIIDPPRNLQELYQLFEKYARSEGLHQRKVESQRKPKDPLQSSRTWTRPSQADSSRDGRS